MDECTIQSLLKLNVNPIVLDGKKVLPIPYEDILRGKISILIEKQETPSLPQLLATPAPTPPKAELDASPTIAFDDEIMIPMEIMKLYPTETLKENMIEDVTNYLKEIAKCWEYHNLGFTPSLLKKAAKARPALNGIIFTTYGKKGDDILSGLVKRNEAFIRKCWREYSPLADN